MYSQGDTAFIIPGSCDLSAMRTAAGCLIGTHEFAGYTDKKEKVHKEDDLCYNSQRTRQQGKDQV